MKYIDIEKIIKESDSDFLKRLPKFVVKLIIRIIRQEQMNQIIEKYKDFEGIHFLPKLIEEFNLTLEVKGKENLPENGKCFFVANHPFGIADGLVLTSLVAEKYGELKDIANEAFGLIPNLRPLIATVNVYGRSSKEMIAALDEVYKSSSPITHFPSGEVSRRYKGKIQDCEWQKSFINKAVSCERNVVPIYVAGQNSRLFYGINTFRRMLGIKINIELILLPHEMFNKKNKTIKVIIGEPVSYTTFDKTHTAHEWAQIVRKKVYNLPTRN